MISPSETTTFPMNPAVANKLMKDSWTSAPGSVLPLEFKAVDHPLRRKSDWSTESTLEESSAYDGELRRLEAEVAQLEGRLTAQAHGTVVQVSEARRIARQEGRQEALHEMQAEVEKERECIKVTCAEFKKDRQDYFAAVEGEVVRLALAIAERVLHREARLDPLLLAGGVRVALDKLAEESTPVLHVPAGEVEAWKAVLGEEGRGTVQIVGDERMALTECTLETNVGRVELGVAVQLAEIERGFFDLMQLRPS